MHHHLNHLLTGYSNTPGLSGHYFYQDKAAVSANAAMSRLQGWWEAVIKNFPVAAKQSACPVNSSALATMVRI